MRRFLRCRAVAGAQMGSDLLVAQTDSSKHPPASSASFLCSSCCFSVFLSPGGVAASQCPKEDSRSSGASHETTGTKRTYDMMEGRISRGLSARDPLSASIEGGSGGNLFTHAVSAVTCRDPIWCPVYMMRLPTPVFWQWLAGIPWHIPAGQRVTGMVGLGTQAGLCFWLLPW